MKRSIIGAFAAVLISMMNVFAESTIQKAYYVDFKNGDVQVLWTDWVESMSVSKIGIDSVVNPKYVTQEIWMSDTVLRFPLDSIERISFVTPPPEFKEGVVRFEDGLENYIIGCDSLTVLLATDTPEKLIPRPGTKVCYLKMTEIFPAAFAGEVKEVRKKSDMIEMECGLTSLTDIFKTYYSTYFEEEEEAMSRDIPRPGNTPTHRSGVYDWNPEQPLSVNFDLVKNLFTKTEAPLPINHRKERLLEDASPGLKKILNQCRESTAGILMNYSFQPNITFRFTHIVRYRVPIGPLPPIGQYICVHAQGEFTNKFNLGIAGGFSSDTKDDDKNRLRLLNLELKRVIPFITPYLEAGAFMTYDVKADLAFSRETTHKVNWIYNFSLNDLGDPMLQPTLKNTYVTPQEIPSTFNTCGLDFEGEIRQGLYMSLGICLLDIGLVNRSGLAQFSLDTELGLKLNANLSIPFYGDSDDDMAWIYNRVKDSHFQIYPYFGLGVGLKVLNKKLDVNGDILPHEYTIGSTPLVDLRLVPEFANLDAKRDTKDLSTVTASANVQNLCIIPWTVGYGAYKPNESSPYRTVFHPNKNWGTEMPKDVFKLSIDSLSTARKFNVVPILDFAGLTIPCTPVAEVEKVMTVKTGKAKNVSSADATLTAVAEKVGSYDAEKGEYKIKVTPVDSSKPTPTVQTVSSIQKGNDIEFQVKATNLTPKTEYTYQAYCEVDEEKVDGEELGFESKDYDGEVLTLAPSFVCAGTAYFQGMTELLDTKDYSSGNHFHFVSAPGKFDTIEDILKASDVNDTRSSISSGLFTASRHTNPTTEYSYFAYCNKPDGTIAYGNIVHFTSESNEINLEQENRQGLKDFFNQIEGPNKESLMNDYEDSAEYSYGHWLSDRPLCLWEGIWHDKSGTSINFYEQLKDMTGEPVLNLSNINDIDLGKVGFSGITFKGNMSTITIEGDKLEYINLEDLNFKKSGFVDNLFLRDNSKVGRISVKRCVSADREIRILGCNNQPEVNSVDFSELDGSIDALNISHLKIDNVNILNNTKESPVITLYSSNIKELQVFDGMDRIDIHIGESNVENIVLISTNKSSNYDPLRIRINIDNSTPSNIIIQNYTLWDSYFDKNLNDDRKFLFNNVTVMVDGFFFGTGTIEIKQFEGTFKQLFDYARIIINDMYD